MSITRVGRAQLLDEDNVHRRLFTMNPINSLFIWLAGRDLATMRVDLAKSDDTARIQTP